MKKSTLSFVSAIIIVLSTFPSAYGVLIGYWNFDEGSGTTAGDTSGNGYNGTLGAVGTGSVTWDSAARFGNSLEFNTPSTTVANATNGGLVTVPFNAAFRLNDSFTISLWWRPDTDYTGGFPGAIRIGSQSATTGTNIGWGFFHNSTEAPTFKRGNAQPTILSPAESMTIGDWHHVLISYNHTTNENIVVQDGQFRTYTQAWLDATSSANLEFGRMDSFSNAGLDDISIFDNAITLGQARSLYTVSESLNLAYSQAEVSALWSIHAGGTGSSASVAGTTWTYTESLPGSPNEGDSYISGSNRYVALSPTTGVFAIPEPGALSLLGLCLLAVARIRRR